MEKEQEEIIKQFKKVEKKLYSAIKKMPNKIQDSNDDEILKQRIKSYILQINEVKAILDEYEDIALEIEKLTNKKQDGSEISKQVVEFREGKTSEATVSISEESVIAEKLENEDKNALNEKEEIVVDGKVVGVKDKKNKKSVREF